MAPRIKLLCILVFSLASIKTALANPFPGDWSASASFPNQVTSGSEFRVIVTYSCSSPGYVYFPIDLVMGDLTLTCGDDNADPRDCVNELVAMHYFSLCDGSVRTRTVRFNLPSTDAVGYYSAWIGYWQGHGSNSIDQWMGADGPFTVELLPAPTPIPASFSAPAMPTLPAAPIPDFSAYFAFYSLIDPYDYNPELFSDNPFINSPGNQLSLESLSIPELPEGFSGLNSSLLFTTLLAAIAGGLLVYKRKEFPFIKPKINELVDHEVSVVNFVKDNGLLPSELTYSLLISDDGIIGAGSPDEFKLVADRFGSSTEYQATLLLDGVIHYFTPDLIITKGLDSDELVVWDNCRPENGCFRFSSDPIEQQAQFNRLLFSNLLDLSVSFALFYSSAKQAGAQTKYFFSNIEFAIHEEVINRFNDYLSKHGLKTINPDFFKSGDGSYFEDNSVYWDKSQGIASEMHEVGHAVSEQVFNENPSAYHDSGAYNYFNEVRADSISYAVNGDLYSDLCLNKLKNIYNGLDVGSFDYLDFKNFKEEFLYHYFLADKFGDQAIASKIGSLLAGGGVDLSTNTFLYNLESEWCMQLKLIGGLNS